MLVTNKILSRAKKPVTEQRNWKHPPPGISFSRLLSVHMVCFGDPQCQISSLPLLSGMSRAVPAPHHRTKPRQQQFLTISCRMLVPLSLDKHQHVATSPSHVEGCLGHSVHTGSTWSLWLENQSSDTILPGINPHHGKTPPSLAHSCSLHHSCLPTTASFFPTGHVGWVNLSRLKHRGWLLFPMYLWLLSNCLPQGKRVCSVIFFFSK